MAYFAVSYQLNKQKDYQALWDAFANLGAHKVMRSFYFVDYSASAQSLLAHLRSEGQVDEDDTICVVPMYERPACYKCFKGTRAWLDARL